MDRATYDILIKVGYGFVVKLSDLSEEIKKEIFTLDENCLSCNLTNFFKNKNLMNIKCLEEGTILCNEKYAVILDERSSIGPINIETISKDINLKILKDEFYDDMLVQNETLELTKETTSPSEMIEKYFSDTNIIPIIFSKEELEYVNQIIKQKISTIVIDKTKYDLDNELNTAIRLLKLNKSNSVVYDIYVNEITSFCTNCNIKIDDSKWISKDIIFCDKCYNDFTRKEIFDKFSYSFEAMRYDVFS